MSKTRRMFAAAVVAAGLLAVSGAWGLEMAFVSVAAPGGVPNTGDTPHGGYGSVAYDYRIGQYEVTAGQYREFLNVVAATDSHALYNATMNSGSFGCHITQSGSSGSYTYDFSGRPSGTDADWSNRPVNYVSWYDAARFTNWMTTGNTEIGVYTFTGGDLTGTMDHQAAASTYGTAYFIPSEDEWYKAAYYSGSGSLYYDYPTGSDTAPTSENPPGSANSANYCGSNWAVGDPYYRNNVGAYTSSDSPYGTFDQGGNVFEWNETLVTSSARGVRGGSFIYIGDNSLRADSRDWNDPADLYDAFYGLGFRVASTSIVPEPGSLGLLLLGLAGMVTRRRRISR